MADPFFDSGEQRRSEVLTHRAADGSWLNGIDYVEVSDDHLQLTVHCLRPLAFPLSGANVAVEGSPTARPVSVVSALASGSNVTVRVKEAGDFSVYMLRLVDHLGHPEPAKGFDPRLAAAQFVFRVECANPLACLPPPDETEAGGQPAELDYLARDYASFRRLMLDRLSLLRGDAHGTHTADMELALVELLAYTGDRLSYYQDAVATEAYLGTARRRTSVRRHARLLDYRMHDGACARAWVTFEVEAGWDQTLPAGTRLLSRLDDSPCLVRPKDFAGAAGPGAVVFETRADATLRASRNAIRFYTWSDDWATLPAGCTRATFQYEAAAPLHLQAGDVLILEQVLSTTAGDDSQPCQEFRHAVRLTGVCDSDSSGQPLHDPLTGTPVVEVEWHPRDRLPFELCLRRGPELINEMEVVKDVAIVRGNVALAEHGLTQAPAPLLPERVSLPYRPRLPSAPLSYRYLDAAGDSAAALGDAEVRNATPSIRLELEGETWLPVPDLLNSDGQSHHFVVETEDDGSSWLRFGDGTHGASPPPGARFLAYYRLGNGSSGNIGADAIGRVVTAAYGITTARNPLPAQGGLEPESLAAVKVAAPQAFRTQMRAVTADDYARIAERHPEVQKAAAAITWTGSWYTVEVTVDRLGGRPLSADPAFRAKLLAHLNRYRLAGFAVDVRDPRYVPLELSLRVHLKPGYWKLLLQSELTDALSSRNLAGGRQGFFHPDHFTFGQPVYLSQVHATVLAVEGVASVETLSFRRRDQPSLELQDQGWFRPAALEIIRLDNDPNRPENGSLTLDVQGGL